MRKLHLGLVQQLGRLETRQCEIGDAITEVKRRIAVLDEVISWNMQDAEIKPEFSQVAPIQPAAVQDEISSVVLFEEELPEEQVFEEELAEDEIFQDSVEFEDSFEDDEEELFEDPVELEESFQNDEEEEEEDAEVYQVNEFRHLDTEGTEIQWVNR